MSPFYCLVFLLAAQRAYAAFSWSNCLPNKHDIDISTIEVKPDPIVLPGDVHLRINGVTTRNISSSTLQIEAKRKTFLGEVHIPCVANIGSCTYTDLCTMIDRMEQENWGGITMGLGTDIRTFLNNAGVNPSQCPLQPTQLNIPDGVLHLPKLSGLLSTLSAGDYHFNIQVTETASASQVLCLDLYMTVEEACSGLGCIFG